MIHPSCVTRERLRLTEHRHILEKTAQLKLITRHDLGAPSTAQTIVPNGVNASPLTPQGVEHSNGYDIVR